MKEKKQKELMKRFSQLPQEMQDILMEDLWTAFENRIIAMERSR